ncbi:MAG: bacteriohemerythrin [Magnetospirillum sp. WYHS-4]
MGIPFVDSDHRVLLRLFNHLETAVGDREDSSVVGSILDSLTEYTKYHFAREEHLMELCGYPQLDAHRETHRRLTGEVGDFMAALAADPGGFDSRRFVDFVRGWLISHILQDDFAYRDICRDKTEAIAQAGACRLTDGMGSGLDWRRLKVLLVEDNPNFRRLIETLLTVAGTHEARSVMSAQEGLDSLMKYPADVVLCDVVMDGMDGVAMAREVFRIDPLTRFVFVSGLDGEVLRRRASAVGVDAVLEKPLSATGLFGAIAKAMDGAVRQ